MEEGFVQLTPRERDLMDLIVKNRQVSLNELQEKMDTKSRSLVLYLLRKLEVKGYVKRKWKYVGPFRVLKDYRVTERLYEEGDNVPGPDKEGRVQSNG